jgi:ribosomal 30S subunit maturation factor RimM
VSDLQFTGEGIGGTPILVIDSAQGELLVPLAQDICVLIDTSARRIEVVLPEGLRELNLE